MNSAVVFALFSFVAVAGNNIAVLAPIKTKLQKFEKSRMIMKFCIVQMLISAGGRDCAEKQNNLFIQY